MFAKTATRVEENTWPEINERIRHKTRERISQYAAAPEDDVRRRLEELDGEWDVERVIENNTSLAVLMSLLLGKLVDKRFYALSAAAGAFLLQHALQGWHPALPALRRLGFRTPREIEHERQALLTAMRARMSGSDGEVFE